MARAHVIVLCALLFACDEEQRRAPLLDDVGDPCRTKTTVCIDDETALACESEVWVERACASLCADKGPAYVASGCDYECICSLIDPGECTPGERSCIDDTAVGVCSDDQQLEPTACDAICTDAGLEPIGCLADEDDPDLGDCWCTAEGTPCPAESPPTCVDGDTLATCEAGTWQFHACAAVCGGPGSCDPHGQPATCSC